MKKTILKFFLAAFLLFVVRGYTLAQRVPSPEPTEDENEATASSTVIEHVEPSPLPPRADLTQKTEETVEPLKRILDSRN